MIWNEQQVKKQYVLFLLGLKGEALFVLLHKLMTIIQPEIFGTICTIVVAFIYTNSSE